MLQRAVVCLQYVCSVFAVCLQYVAVCCIALQRHLSTGARCCKPFRCASTAAIHHASEFFSYSPPFTEIGGSAVFFALLPCPPLLFGDVALHFPATFSSATFLVNAAADAADAADGAAEFAAGVAAGVAASVAAVVGIVAVGVAG